ncbi:hypothetical protein J3459_018379 [Metarhizium acridum]|nr:hypothetical protein J3459_018379 [Metarhizium acridum]
MNLKEFNPHTNTTVKLTLRLSVFVKVIKKEAVKELAGYIPDNPVLKETVETLRKGNRERKASADKQIATEQEDEDEELQEQEEALERDARLTEKRKALV